MHFFDTSSNAAHLHSGELVAVKVQRPGMAPLLTLDALLFHMIGGQMKRFAKARKDLLVAVNEIVSFYFFLTWTFRCLCYSDHSFSYSIFFNIYICHDRLITMNSKDHFIWIQNYCKNGLECLSRLYYK